jgi:hypothetical protein
MGREPAGGGTAKATSRPRGARTYRRSGIPGPRGRAASTATPGSGSNGSHKDAAGQVKGLAFAVVQDPQPSQRDLSGPVSERPGKIVTPKEGKATHLARSRLVLALCSVALLGFVVVASFMTLWRGGNIDNLTRLLEIIFAPLVAVVGVAVAFYYRGSSL